MELRIRKLRKLLPQLLLALAQMEVRLLLLLLPLLLLLLLLLPLLLLLLRRVGCCCPAGLDFVASSPAPVRHGKRQNVSVKSKERRYDALCVCVKDRV